MSSNSALDFPGRVAALADAPVTDARGLATQLVDTIIELRAQIDVLEALETRVLSVAAGLAEAQATRDGTRTASQREMPLRSLAAEFAAALRVSDRTMQSRMKTAQDLVTRFPESYHAWESGRITRRHTVVIHEAGRGIDDVDAREAFERVAVRAAEIETPGRLAPIAKILAARFDPRTVDERHAVARDGRRVWVEDQDAGMSELHAIMPTVLAHGIHDRLTQQAKAVIRMRAGSRDAGDGGSADAGPTATAGASDSPAGDTRTLDQDSPDAASRPGAAIATIRAITPSAGQRACAISSSSARATTC